MMYIMIEDKDSEKNHKYHLYGIKEYSRLRFYQEVYGL